MTKTKQRSKAIDRAETVIQNRIFELQKKIEVVKERWPEDMYGLRWEEKANGFQEEIDELLAYQEATKHATGMQSTAEQYKRDAFQYRTLIGKACDKLMEYGEYTFADNLRYRAGLKL